jgi:hypothetical protein
MKSLYDSEHRYTVEALELNERVYRALKPIFEEKVAEGYSPREISHVIRRLFGIWN